MLKKMRRRFTAAAMAAFSAVILLLSLAVNLWNYHITASQQDQMLAMLIDGGLNDIRDDRRPINGDMDIDMDIDMKEPAHFGRFSPEMKYMTRYFTVCLDSDGAITEIQQDFIAAVSEEQAEEYARALMKRDDGSGYYMIFRYLKRGTEDGTTIIFLNAERELQSMRNLALVTLAVALGSTGAVFILVRLLSARAIAPYIRNIETQKRFITDASHELKTPLTAIATSADILAMEREGDEWVKNIQDQTARLARLITNLVTLSRLDEEQPFPEKGEFSLSDAIWEIAEPFSSLAEAKGKRYSQSIEEGLTLYGDRAAIQQMASILLDNAVKYSDEGGAIRLDVHRDHRRTVISVANTCSGLDAHGLDRLFDRFYRPDGSRSSKTGGTGIGLSIAKATAQAHEGDISVKSRNGEIIFTVTL